MFQTSTEDYADEETEMETINAALWEYFNDATPAALRQARATIYDRYGGDFNAYTVEYLQPTLQLLSEIKRVSKIYFVWILKI